VTELGQQIGVIINFIVRKPKTMEDPQQVQSKDVPKQKKKILYVLGKEKKDLEKHAKHAKHAKRAKHAKHAKHANNSNGIKDVIPVKKKRKITKFDKK
tara:strand:- start:178 stop:471 length:294 start_codon:yes stop_codon:yes gene_type:complete